MKATKLLRSGYDREQAGRREENRVVDGNDPVEGGEGTVASIEIGEGAMTSEQILFMLGSKLQPINDQRRVQYPDVRVACDAEHGLPPLSIVTRSTVKDHGSRGRIVA